MFATIVRAAPHFGRYQARTRRELPAVELAGAPLTPDELSGSLRTG